MFSRFFIDRPIFAFVISILLVLAGLAATLEVRKIKPGSGIAAYLSEPSLRPSPEPKVGRTPRPVVQAVQESNPEPSVEDLSAVRLRPRRVTVIK